MRCVSTVATALLVVIFFSTNTIAQSTYATVSGFVQDPSQAFIPGVTVTATNTQTGVTTTAITNESGAYTIVSLLPGTYKLTAELAGFKTQVISDVQLGQSATARYNFTLQVGALADSVEVTAEATALIAEILARADRLRRVADVAGASVPELAHGADRNVGKGGITFHGEMRSPSTAASMSKPHGRCAGRDVG